MIKYYRLESQIKKGGAMTTNKEYIEKLLANNDRIIIDTASLMLDEGFQNFIDRYHQLFLSNGVPIRIPGSVYQELVRHLISENGEKATKAQKALGLIQAYNDLFELDSVGFSEKELRKAFADREIYNLLLQGRERYRQILITNDRVLCRDAQNINKIESCTGKNISVCYIHKNGVLYNSGIDMVTSGTTEKEELLSSSVPAEEAAEMPTAEEYESVQLPQRKKWWWVPRVGVGALLFGTGFGFGKNRKQLMNIMTSIFRL